MNKKELIGLLKACATDKEDICDSCKFAEGECTMGLIKEVAEALEKREQGCDYCKGVTKTGAIRLEDDFGRSLNYCPMCGRKLV